MEAIYEGYGEYQVNPRFESRCINRSIQRRRRRRIINKIKLVAVISLMVCMAFVLGGFILGQDAVASASEIPTYEEVVIGNHQTIWSVASEYLPADTSMNAFVEIICDANNITDPGNVQPYQSIMVPVYE
jgi:hypothetical protein